MKTISINFMNLFIINYFSANSIFNILHLFSNIKIILFYVDNLFVKLTNKNS